ncbi:MAG TPA: hypothetical protein VM388_03860 [Acidimicrobiales bacterium]|nr:hypothetical protein [Acidimicrobiales bacterium]HWI02843.1 hypothetical protein [Acidimicrobiales bacterium]
MPILLALAIVVSAGTLYLAATRPCMGHHGHRHWRLRRHHRNW